MIYRSDNRAMGVGMTYAIEEKWGDAVLAGFTQVPDMLFRQQGTLGITPTELVVLLNICTAWWKAEKLPFPSSAAIARRMNVQPRTVQAAVGSLERKGLLVRSRISGLGGVRHKYDLAPLRSRLEREALRDRRVIAVKEKRDAG
jgi:predicted transcriptional regulator